MKRHLIKVTAASALMSLPFGFAQAATSAINYSQLSYNLVHYTNLTPKAVEMAFAGYQWALAHNNVRKKDILTIVDFSLPSYKDRLYVVNMKSGQILMKLPVTHGKNSGDNSPWATHFSNKVDSLQSSLGVFVTQHNYVGEHGFSLRINGLESSNNHVLSRSVVIHAANYATPEFIKRFGRAGTSYGCFAVDPKKNKELIHDIEGGSIMYAYGKSREYMASTKIRLQTSA